MAFQYSSPIGLVACLFMAVTLFYSWNSRAKKARIPILPAPKGIWRLRYNYDRYLKDSKSVIMEGYEKVQDISQPGSFIQPLLVTYIDLTVQYSKHGKFFQIPTPTAWIVVVPPKYIKEILAAPETSLNHAKAASMVVQPKYTISPIVEQDKFHFGTIRTRIVPNIGSKLGEIEEEAQLSIVDEIGTPTDWTPIRLSPKAHRIVARTTNRVLVGPALCRNEEYIEMSTSFPREIFKVADVLRSYPDFLKWPISYFVSDASRHLKTARYHLLPLVKQRLKQKSQERDDGTEKVINMNGIQDNPNDALQWIIDAAPETEFEPMNYVYRVLHLKAAALYTTAATFANCIFDLAMHPDVQSELRVELEKLVDGKVLNVQILNSLTKLDSFMLESQRLTPLASSVITRYVVHDFTFSDGTTVCAGSTVVVPSYAIHRDDANYPPDAATFDAFRFSRLRESEKEGEMHRHQYVSTSATHLSFGHGKLACPGRAFAAVEIKTLLAQMIINYDFKMPENTKPKSIWYDRSQIPDPMAEVLFRARTR